MFTIHELEFILACVKDCDGGLYCGNPLSDMLIEKIQKTIDDLDKNDQTH